MNKLVVLLTTFLITFSSCSKDEVVNDGVADIIDRDIVLFNPGSLPKPLTDVLADNKLILFGETHYVQEHQGFLSTLLPVLSELGYKVILDELFHCFGWLVEEYIDGNVEELPETLLFFNETLIEGIKEFNKTVDASSGIQLVYMDANHWRSNFNLSISEMEKVIGPQSVFSGIKNTPVDTDAYLNELRNAEELLRADSSNYISGLGEIWYRRILEMITVEAESAEFRMYRIDQQRENLMFDNIDKIIKKNPDKKILVNTGMFHGQKKTLMGVNIDRIGKILTDKYDGVFSISFVGVSGETKRTYSEENNIVFNLESGALDNDIIKYIDEIAKNYMSFLPLIDNIFKNQSVRISYTYGNTIEKPIGQQFDAIITYPEISVLTSMGKYDFE